MPRPEKVQAVADIKERFEEAQAVFLAEYAGLSVKEQQELRRGLRAAEGEFKVVKMTLARLAVEELGHEGLLEMLTGPTGLAYADADPAALAKVLRDYANDHNALVLKGALFGGEVLPPERVALLADLEPRDVLLARIAGAFQAPLAQMAGLLAAFPRNLATMIQQLIEKLPDEAPAEEPPAAEAPEAEAPEAEAPETEAPEAEAVAETKAAEAAEADTAPADEAPADEVAEEAAAEDKPEEKAETADAATAEAPAPEADEAQADEAEEE